MKHTIKLIQWSLPLLVMTGCNFDPDALLGNKRQGGNPVLVSKHEVCRDKVVQRESNASYGYCSAPGELADFVHSVSDVYGEEKIRFMFNKLRYSDHFPKINHITFRTYGYSSPTYRNLKCEEVVDESMPERFKVVDCWIVKKETDSEFTDYYFDSMELSNGGKECDPSASSNVYRTQFLHDSCTPDDFYPYSGEIYLNRERVPTLNPRSDTPANP